MAIKYDNDKTEDSQLEEITITINPKTLVYTLQCKYAYVEDAYIVLREIVKGFETGEVAHLFSLEDVESGKPATAEQFAAVVESIKERIDESFEEKTSVNLARDFRN